MKKSRKAKITFFVSENITLLIVALFFIFVLVATYHIDCDVTRNVTMPIATSVLASVMFPLGLNIGKVLHEKRMLNNICKSLVAISIVLIGNLNSYIALTGKKPFSCYSELKKHEDLSELDFKGLKVLEELFEIIPLKLNDMFSMKYIINMPDSFELSAKRLDSSIPNGISNGNYQQLFHDLIMVIGIVGHVKSPFRKRDYIKQFDVGIQKSYKEAEYVYFRSTDEYIVQCLENDLSQRMNEM